MRQRERPEPQVRRGVRDRPQHELDGLDHLVNEHLAEIELFAVAVATAAATMVLCQQHLL